MHKKIIVSIGILLFVAAVGLIMILSNDSTEWGYHILDIGLGLGQLLGLMLLISNGTTFGTVYWKIIVGFLVVSIFGSLLKILHYNYADESLMVGFVGVAIAYLIRFLAKKEKRHLDFLKLFWVLSAYIGGELIVLHILPKELTYLIQGIFWITLFDFIWLEFKSKTSAG